MANYGAIEPLELDRIECPVLLIHGDVDTDSLPEDSRSAHQTIRNCTLVTMQNGTHLAFCAHPEAALIQERARRFVTEHA